MPYKSKSQERLFFSKESKGELPKGTAKRWARHTPDQKSLPEHVKKEASAAEISTFVKAAMARYAELGVPRDIAEELFARKMTKVAEQLGMALPEDPNKRIVKLATAKLVKKGFPEEQARVMLTHEFSKQAFIDKVARVKQALMTQVKKAQIGTPQDADLDAALKAKASVQNKLKPPPPPPVVPKPA